MLQGNGILDFIIFIISAVSSGIIRSKVADDANSSKSSTLQPIPAVVAQAPPIFVLTAPQPTLAGHGDHPPSYSPSYFANVPPSSKASGYVPSAEDNHSVQNSAGHDQKSNVTTEAAAAVPPQKQPVR